MHIAPRPSPYKIRRNGFVAEIISSRNLQSELFHYVVQKEGSSGIVHWGQETSFERALESVEDFLSEYEAKQA